MRGSAQEHAEGDRVSGHFRNFIKFLKILPRNRALLEPCARAGSLWSSGPPVCCALSHGHLGFVRGFQGYEVRECNSTRNVTLEKVRRSHFVVLRVGLPLNFPELRRHFTPLLRTWGVARELEESEGE